MQKELTVEDLDSIEVRARLAKGRNWGVMETDPTALLSLVAECRELRRLRGALEYLLLQDNWYLKNTCGISLPCHNGAQSVLILAKERGWKEGT